MAGKILIVTEGMSGILSLPGVTIPKLPHQIFNPADPYRGLLRELARKVGWRKAEMMIRQLSRNRGLMRGAKGTFVVTMFIEAGISAKCGFTCGKKAGAKRPFVLF